MVVGTLDGTFDQLITATFGDEITVKNNEAGKYEISLIGTATGEAQLVGKVMVFGTVTHDVKATGTTAVDGKTWIDDDEIQLGTFDQAITATCGDDTKVTTNEAGKIETSLAGTTTTFDQVLGTKTDTGADVHVVTE
jgi:hypothetical protein